MHPIPPGSPAARSVAVRTPLLLLPLVVLVAAGILAPANRAGSAEVRFNRDIRPILADHCFPCHGPDAASRKAKLRLDLRDGATEERRDGPAIVPGDPGKSPVMTRVLTEDPDEVMPPPDMKKPLSDRQKALLESWIRDGATYEGHWAYQPIERPAEPAVEEGAGGARSGPVRNSVDRFVLARLKERGWQPAPEADRATLFRRLNLDLTGLPPKPEEMDAFLTDPDPEAYERRVEALLNSPHYGERMAMFWLDLVRYADTVGYHGDQDYSVWPYRDYVIRAFNGNTPFDQFTTENLAGDLLENPTRDQRIASGYNRLLMITAEGGAQDREYRAKYAADRVRNASTVWLGVTLGCAECHDHKYDPFTTRDFYSFAAYFADLKEKGFYDRGYPAGDWGPSMKLPDQAQAAELDRKRDRVAALELTLNTTTPALAEAQANWEETVRATRSPELGPWQVLGPYQEESFDAAFRRDFGPETGIDLLEISPDGEGMRWMTRSDWEDGRVIELTGDNSATYLFRTIRSEQAQEFHLSLGSDDALRVWLNDVEVLTRKVQRAAAPDQDALKVNLAAGENRLLIKVVNGGGGYAFFFRAVGLAPKEVMEWVRTPVAERTEEQRSKLAAHFRGINPLLEETRVQLADERKALAALESAIPSTLVSEALAEPRMTRVLRRGNWLDDGGDVVEPAVPAVLRRSVVSSRRQTRRDLAEWLMSPENPLTSRVFVNRLWRQYFGAGLSRKLEDIGANGEWPTHPELLDWLASEFRDSGWNVKHLVRLLVTSSTYRRQSTVDDQARELDPDNRMLARQTAFRLDAELVRDVALSVSGLLVDTLGGPSARPYQPAGYYSQLNFPRREYQADQGLNQYRRGLYTHWQRTFLHPSLAAFDAPTREECTAERVRSNTPQQALVLLNDPTYLEAARGLAERILREGGRTVASRIRFAIREVLGRDARPEEFEVLGALAAAHLRDYTADADAANQVLAIGDRPVPADLSRAELAAWTSVARAILNLHETITRA